jgi:hypothetical protein
MGKFCFLKTKFKSSRLIDINPLICRSQLLNQLSRTSSQLQNKTKHLTHPSFIHSFISFLSALQVSVIPFLGPGWFFFFFFFFFLVVGGWQSVRGRERWKSDISAQLFSFTWYIASIRYRFDMSGWPSGLRRQFKALVFGRGFESHFGHKLHTPR